MTWVYLKRTTLTSAVATTLLLGSTRLAAADAVKYDGMCAMGLAMQKTIQTGCRINEKIAGMKYCFGSEEAKFMETPEANIAKA